MLSWALMLPTLLGVLTAPFAPRVTLEPALIDVPPAGRTLQVPPQTHDRQVLRLLLVRGGGVSAVLHPHVGTMVESGSDVQRVLEGSGVLLH